MTSWQKDRLAMEARADQSMVGSDAARARREDNKGEAKCDPKHTDRNHRKSRMKVASADWLAFAILRFILSGGGKSASVSPANR